MYFVCRKQKNGHDKPMTAAMRHYFPVCRGTSAPGHVSQAYVLKPTGCEARRRICCQKGVGFRARSSLSCTVQRYCCQICMPILFLLDLQEALAVMTPDVTTPSTEQPGTFSCDWKVPLCNGNNHQCNDMQSAIVDVALLSRLEYSLQMPIVNDM